MSIGDALTNIIPVFIQEEAIHCGVYLAAWDFGLQITFNGIAGSSGTARLLILLVQDFNFHNCLKVTISSPESGEQITPWI